MVLRGCNLRNTKFIIGVAAYTGFFKWLKDRPRNKDNAQLDEAKAQKEQSSRVYEQLDKVYMASSNFNMYILCKF